MNKKSIYITDLDFKRLQELVKAAREFNQEEEKYVDRLQEELNKATIVEENRLPKKIVTMNSKVELFDLADKETMSYILVFPEVANIDKGKISILSPLGTALLGEKEGDEIELNLVHGTRKIKIIKVN